VNILRLLLVLLAVCASSASAAKVTYAISKDLTRLTGTLGGVTVTLVDYAKRVPAFMFGSDDDGELQDWYKIFDVKVRDLDGDGYEDALITTGHGGNCCPSDYRVVSLKPGRSVRITNAISPWADPVFERWNGRVVVKARFDEQAAWVRYAFTGTALKVVDRQPIAELKAVTEVRVGTFNPRRPSVQVDVNGDGRLETMTCRVWDRWNTLVCGVKDAQGRTLLPDDTGCDRYGMLTTRTKGYVDVVCGLDGVFRWNGRQYVLQEK